MATTLGDLQGGPSQVGGPNQVDILIVLLTSLQHIDPVSNRGYDFTKLEAYDGGDCLGDDLVHLSLGIIQLFLANTLVEVLGSMTPTSIITCHGRHKKIGTNSEGYP